MIKPFTTMKRIKYILHPRFELGSGAQRGYGVTIPPKKILCALLVLGHYGQRVKFKMCIKIDKMLKLNVILHFYLK